MHAMQLYLLRANKKQTNGIVWKSFSRRLPERVHCSVIQFSETKTYIFETKRGKYFCQFCRS